MKKIAVFAVLGVTFGLLIAVVVAQQPKPDRKILKQLVVTIEEVREVLKPQDWRPKAPPEPLPIEPSGSITSAAIFQDAGDMDLLLFAILYWFETEERAKEFYAQPIVFNAEGSAEKDSFKELSELLSKELAVGKGGAEEARLVEDPVSRNPVLQFRKAAFVGRLRLARLSQLSTLELPVVDLIKVAKKQLEKLVAFLKGS